MRRSTACMPRAAPAGTSTILYPLRYNKIVADLTEKTTGEHIIWARSAWAGSQRYPLHWGGDAENTDSAMAATLRAGLSFGLSGFTYWSHDAGGFVGKAPRDLYRRWLPFSALSSHTRCHGAPPREPWEYDEEFTDDFRRTIELRYQLLPYIYAEAQHSSDHGYPLVRPLFFEFHTDPGVLARRRRVHVRLELARGAALQRRRRAERLSAAGRMDRLSIGPDLRRRQVARASRPGAVPIVVLVRGGSAIPLAKVAQSTGDIDWEDLELRVFSDERRTDHRPRRAAGWQGPRREALARFDGKFKLDKDPLKDDVRWRITNATGE